MEDEYGDIIIEEIRRPRSSLDQGDQDRSSDTIFYRRGKFLGRGGFAKCYVVMNLQDRSKHAMKVVSKKKLTKAKAKKKLQTEIKIHKGLSHPHVVRFERFFEDVDNVYILLELCHNRSMTELMRHRLRLIPDELRYFGRQMLLAIKYLHQNGVIHRDLKLGNLFIDRHMQIKVGDFGLAAKVHSQNERKKTICGTPNYIAPEILTDKDGHSFQVDIWSLGVIFYTIIVGKPPYEATDVKSTYRRIIANSYSFPSDGSENDDASKGTSGVVCKYAKHLIKMMLQTKPASRPTIDEIQRHPFFHRPGRIIPRVLPQSTMTSPTPSEYFIATTEVEEENGMEKKIPHSLSTGSNSDRPPSSRRSRDRFDGSERKALQTVQQQQQRLPIALRDDSVSRRDDEDLKGTARSSRSHRSCRQCSHEKSPVDAPLGKENLHEMGRMRLRSGKILDRDGPMLGTRRPDGAEHSPTSSEASKSSSTTPNSSPQKDEVLTDDKSKSPRDEVHRDSHQESPPASVESRRITNSQHISPKSEVVTDIGLKISDDGNSPSKENEEKGVRGTRSTEYYSRGMAPFCDNVSPDAKEDGTNRDRNQDSDPKYLMNGGINSRNRKDESHDEAELPIRDDKGRAANRPSEINIAYRRVESPSRRVMDHETLESVLCNVRLALKGHPNRSSSSPRGNSGLSDVHQYVVNYVDYTSKYGLGYTLNDGTTGVYFNDASKIAVSKDGTEFLFLERNFETNCLTTIIANMDDYPEELHKKVTLLKHFREYLQNTDGSRSGGSPHHERDDRGVKKVTRDAPAAISDHHFSIRTLEETKNLIYVRKWIKTRHAILFHLSDRVIQIVFYDQSEILLHPTGRHIMYGNSVSPFKACLIISGSYVNKYGIRESLRLYDVVDSESPRKDIMKRLK